VGGSKNEGPGDRRYGRSEVSPLRGKQAPLNDSLHSPKCGFFGTIMCLPYICCSLKEVSYGYVTLFL
jgi:hypothetical protein